MEHEGESDTSYSQSPWKDPKQPGKETEGTGDPGMDWDYPDKNTKSPRDLRRLAVSWTLMETMTTMTTTTTTLAVVVAGYFRCEKLTNSKIRGEDRIVWFFTICLYVYLSIICHTLRNMKIISESCPNLNICSENK